MITAQLARAGGAPVCPGRLRTEATDFRVDEVLGFEPDGQGEHLFLQIEKTGLSTPRAAGEIARWLGVHQRQVSWSGLKDRNAVTRQWLGVHLPGVPMPEEVVPGAEPAPGLRVLRAAFHGRKLRPGSHAANRFCLRVRALGADAGAVEAALSRLARQGAPNYFGDQRFGHDGSNLDPTVRRRGRQARAMHLSALRAQMFNAVLDRRVRDGSWCHVLEGDALQFADGNSFFVDGQATEETQRRVDAGELHVTGPLFGDGAPLVAGAAQDLEDDVLSGFPEPCTILRKARMRPARRALRVFASGLSWEFPVSGEVQVEFELRPGSYATSVLREVLAIEDATTRHAA